MAGGVVSHRIPIAVARKSIDKLEINFPSFCPVGTWTMTGISEPPPVPLVQSVSSPSRPDMSYVDGLSLSCSPTCAAPPSVRDGMACKPWLVSCNPTGSYNVAWHGRIPKQVGVLTPTEANGHPLPFGSAVPIHHFLQTNVFGEDFHGSTSLYPSPNPLSLQKV